MRDHRRLVVAILFLIVSSPLWSATRPIIESALVNTQANEITITGKDFDPHGIPPNVTLATEELAVVHATDQKIVAKLPFNLPAGSYRLAVTNSSSWTTTVFVTISSVEAQGPGQIYTGSAALDSYPSETTAMSLPFPLTLGYQNFPAQFTIIPAACTVTALYAANAPRVNGFAAVPSISVAVLKNSVATAFPACQVSSAVPISCALPTSPLSVSAGDTLSYLVTIPAHGGVVYSSSVNLTLQCK